MPAGRIIFPFIAGESPGPFPLPAGHDASDQIYGLLWVTPVILLGAAEFLQQILRPIRNLDVFAFVVGSVNILLLGAFWRQRLPLPGRLPALIVSRCRNRPPQNFRDSYRLAPPPIDHVHIWHADMERLRQPLGSRLTLR